MPTKRKLAVLLIKDKQIIISHFYLINIHIFDYPDSRLSGLFTEVPTSPDNRGSTVLTLRNVWYLWHASSANRMADDAYTISKIFSRT